MVRINEYRNLSPDERLERVCDILVRGMHILAEKRGWVKQPKYTLSSYPYSRKKEHNQSLYDIEERALANKTYSVKESAEILKISKKTLFRWIKEEKIKAQKQSNGYYRICQKDLGLMMAKHAN